MTMNVRAPVNDTFEVFVGQGYCIEQVILMGVDSKTGITSFESLTFIEDANAPLNDCLIGFTVYDGDGSHVSDTLLLHPSNDEPGLLVAPDDASYMGASADLFMYGMGEGSDMAYGPSLGGKEENGDTQPPDSKGASEYNPYGDRDDTYVYKPDNIGGIDGGNLNLSDLLGDSDKGGMAELLDNASWGSSEDKGETTLDALFNHDEEAVPEIQVEDAATTIDAFNDEQTVQDLLTEIVKVTG
jgi:hypothetical protein